MTPMPKSQVKLKRSLKTCEQCVRLSILLSPTQVLWSPLHAILVKLLTLPLGAKLCHLLNDTGPSSHKLKHLILDYNRYINLVKLLETSLVELSKYQIF